MGNIMVQTKRCPRCKRRGSILVDGDGYASWVDGAPIHDALPALTYDQREQLISGYDPVCWFEEFGTEDD